MQEMASPPKSLRVYVVAAVGVCSDAWQASDSWADADADAVGGYSREMRNPAQPAYHQNQSWLADETASWECPGEKIGSNHTTLNLRV